MFKPHLLIAICIAWKNQESLKYWLVGFGLVGIQKCQKFLPTIFFWVFELFMDLLITLIYFPFSNIIPGGVPTC